MKKLACLAAILIPVLVFANTVGRSSAAVNGSYTLTAKESSCAYVENIGTNTVYVSWGGYAVASTNDPDTYFAYRMPIAAGTSYTTRGKFSVISVYCATNGLVNLGFEGAE